MIARRGFLASLFALLTLPKGWNPFAPKVFKWHEEQVTFLGNWTPRAPMLEHQKEVNISEGGIHRSKGGLIGSEDGGATR